MTTLVVAPGTPYVTPTILKSAPTGISWTSIPWRNATTAEQNAAQLNICSIATAQADSFCNQPLRATVDTETIIGPGTFRCQIQPNGVARIILSRSPVVSVLGGRVTPAGAFPATWTALAANQFRPERPIIGQFGSSAPSSAGEGGQAILASPSVLNWWFGRANAELEVTYVNGWPHGSLTADTTTAATSIAVDDITGWLGCAGTIYSVGTQETILATAVTPATTGAVSGPGTLALASALANVHTAGTMVTALPGVVVQAAILFSVGQALVRGATATTVQNQPGASAGAGKDPEAFVTNAEILLHPYRRVL